MQNLEYQQRYGHNKSSSATKSVTLNPMLVHFLDNFVFVLLHNVALANAKINHFYNKTL